MYTQYSLYYWLVVLWSVYDPSSVPLLVLLSVETKFYFTKYKVQIDMGNIWAGFLAIEHVAGK